MTNRVLALVLSGMLATTIGACAGARVDPQFSAEPRLEATIEALGEQVARLRVERDSLAASTDSLCVELARLRLELQRLKDIDLKRRRPRAR
jgi:hypothetical protein